jgi:hypothetical protein
MSEPPAERKAWRTLAVAHVATALETIAEGDSYAAFDALVESLGRAGLHADLVDEALEQGASLRYFEAHTEPRSWPSWRLTAKGRDALKSDQWDVRARLAMGADEVVRERSYLAQVIGAVPFGVRVETKDDLGTQIMTTGPYDGPRLPMETLEWAFEEYCVALRRLRDGGRVISDVDRLAILTVPLPDTLSAHISDETPAPTAQ